MNDFVWPAVRVDGDLERARVEWVHGNGAGAYASSTVAQMHTRRYHGLLVAALDPPRSRHVLVSHVDASVQINGTLVGLATHQFPGVPPTAGHRLLTNFAQDPLPRWTYQLPGGTLEHCLCLARGHNVLVLKYTWSGEQPVVLELRPLLAMRPFHDLVGEHGAMIQRVEMRQNEVSVQPVRTLPRVVFRHRGAFIGSPDWWRKFEYLGEQVRGMDFHEDLWTPGLFRMAMEPGKPVFLTCGAESVPDTDPSEMMQETLRSVQACDPGPRRCWAVRSLSVAADLFRVDLAPTPGVIAGYPWFELWGRHTLLSLQGLYLVQGKVQEAKRVVAALIGYMRNGLIPNRLPDDGRPAEYHSVDATLLLFPIAHRMMRMLGPSDEFVSTTLMPCLRECFETLMRGTVDGIHVSDDGLLAAGKAGTSLTWMDARVAGKAVTSRAGHPIEVQAMWSLACASLGAMAEKAGDEELSSRAYQARDKAREAFRRRFWCSATSYPYDVIPEQQSPSDPGDPAIRPNALAALALDNQLFTREQAEAIIARVERDLMTPAGIRTLSPFEPGYFGRYAGTERERDLAYHQGTAWPFMMSAFSRALRATYPDDKGRAERLRAMIEGMLSNQLALGQVPEIADGDPPHRPNGCVAHAVSVGELLRVLVEDLKL